LGISIISKTPLVRDSRRKSKELRRIDSFRISAECGTPSCGYASSTRFGYTNPQACRLARQSGRLFVLSAPRESLGRAPDLNLITRNYQYVTERDNLVRAVKTNNELYPEKEETRSFSFLYSFFLPYTRVNLPSPTNQAHRLFKRIR